MIYGSIKNLSAYVGISANIDKAIAWVASNDLMHLPAGKHTIDNDKVFLLMNTYETKAAEDCVSETHKKYIDIQLMLSGTELFGYAPLEDQQIVEGYNQEKDYTFYHAEMNYLTLKEGYFAIFFPTDIHQPNIAVDGSIAVKKAVIKVQVD
jgi:YhcH/YjgK/YiaL family protein